MQRKNTRMNRTMRPKHCFKGEQKIKDAEKEEQDQDAEEADEEPKQPNQLKQTNHLKPRQDKTDMPKNNHTDCGGATPKEEEILRRDS